MIGYDSIRVLAPFLCDSFGTTVHVYWLYPQAGSKMTAVIAGFTFTCNIQGKREFISSGGSLKSVEISILKAPARLPSHLRVPNESQPFSQPVP